MKKVLFLLLLCALLFAFSGCASIITGKFQKVPVTSDPPGVKVQADTGESIMTPGNLNLSRNEQHTLVAEYPGAEPQQKTLKNDLQGWFWGNIILGGVIGGVIDLASGACDELQPKEIHFDFTQAGQQLANQRSAYLKEHSGIEEKYAFAIEHGLLTNGMTREQVLVSLGQPDEEMTEKKKMILVYSKPKPAKLTFRREKLVTIEDLK